MRLLLSGIVVVVVTSCTGARSDAPEGWRAAEPLHVVNDRRIVIRDVLPTAAVGLLSPDSLLVGGLGGVRIEGIGQAAGHAWLPTGPGPREVQLPTTILVGRTQVLIHEQSRQRWVLWRRGAPLDTLAYIQGAGSPLGMGERGILVRVRLNDGFGLEWLADMSGQPGMPETRSLHGVTAGEFAPFKPGTKAVSVVPGPDSGVYVLDGMRFNLFRLVSDSLHPILREERAPRRWTAPEITAFVEFGERQRARGMPGDYPTADQLRQEDVPYVTPGDIALDDHGRIYLASRSERGTVIDRLTLPDRREQVTVEGCYVRDKGLQVAQLTVLLVCEELTGGTVEGLPGVVLTLAGDSASSGHR